MATPVQSNTASSSFNQAEWETRVQQLQSSNEELQHRKTDAEKDRDLFRELYGKASSHATDVTKENNELLERATLAESQLKEGMALLKGTYEARVKQLEVEVLKWKGRYEILVERDKRMNGDSVREKAALAEELKHENEKLKGDLEALREDWENMEETYAEAGDMELQTFEEEVKAPNHTISKEFVSQHRVPITDGEAVAIVRVV
ncbi:hypothetical protein ABKN59_004413 [Abortiporus biennis]